MKTNTKKIYESPEIVVQERLSLMCPLCTSVNGYTEDLTEETFTF